jgi:hypothetical protein
VQHGILCRTEDESETMPPVVAEYDQINVELARHAQELYLHTPDLDSPARLLGARFAGEICHVFLRSLNQFFLSLDEYWCYSVRWNGRHDGRWLYHMEYLEIRAEGGRKCSAAFGDCEAAFGEIDSNQNAMINRHWLEKTCVASGNTMQGKSIRSIDLDQCDGVLYRRDLVQSFIHQGVRLACDERQGLGTTRVDPDQFERRQMRSR